MGFEWPFKKKREGAGKEGADFFEIIDSDEEIKDAVRRKEIVEAIDRAQKAIEFMSSQSGRLPGTTEQKEAGKKNAEDLRRQLEEALSAGKVSRELWKKKNKFLKER